MEEVVLAIKEMKNGKATEVDGIPIELVKCLGEGKKEILSLFKNIYNEGEWPEEFMETVLLPIGLPKKSKEFRTISLISQTAKILLRILNQRLRSKMEEEQFGFKKGKGTRDAIGLIQTIGKRYIEKDKDVCVQYLLTSQKHLTRVDWKEGRLLSNLYMKQRISQDRRRNVRGKRNLKGSTARMSSSPTLFNIYLKILMKNCFLYT